MFDEEARARMLLKGGYIIGAMTEFTADQWTAVAYTPGLTSANTDRLLFIAECRELFDEICQPKEPA